MTTEIRGMTEVNVSSMDGIYCNGIYSKFSTLLSTHQLLPQGKWDLG
jgi:hypothetical protein